MVLIRGRSWSLGKTGVTRVDFLRVREDGVFFVDEVGDNGSAGGDLESTG
jgi:hypothetical protein